MRDLTVAVLSPDEWFARGIAAVCARRGHAVCRLASLDALRRGRAPSVLLLDAAVAQAETLRVAATVTKTHPGLALVAAGAGIRLRSSGGVRLVDRFGPPEAIVDEVELAHVGIPAFVENPLRSSAHLRLMSS